MESGQNKANKNQQDLERIRRILRDIADKLAKANKSLKQSQPEVSHAHGKKAEEAAEKLRRALEQLKKSRKSASHKKLEGASCPLPQTSAMKHGEQTSKSGLPVYEGDFVDKNERDRLTGLPPITADEIKSTNWDDIWDYI